jgi:hypothetical protein
MKYFLDTEFLEGKQKTFFNKETVPTIDLISIGIVAEDGREYYAISKDFNLKEAWNRYDEKPNMDYKPNFGGGSDGHYNPQFIRDYWIRDNVLKPIYLQCRKWELAELYDDIEQIESYITDKERYRRIKYFINKYGKTNKQIAEEIIEFTSTSECRMVEKYGDKPEFYGYGQDKCFVFINFMKNYGSL